MRRVKVLHQGVIEPSLSGRYNVQNTLAAVAVAALLGASPGAVAEGVRSFPGVKRRLETFLEHNGVTFVDDFAHHPTAIRETIGAARERWPQARLVVLFEPRSNTTVTRAFQGEMEASFAGADVVWLGLIYRGDRIPEAERLDRVQ